MPPTPFWREDHFINEIADLCEKVGGNAGCGARHRDGQPHRQQVPACRAGLWRKLLSQGYAGAAETAEDYDSPTRIVEVVKVNDSRKRAMGRKVVEALGGPPRRAARRRRCWGWPSSPTPTT
jgi:UDPglucose 6-dehydrogenase